MSDFFPNKNSINLDYYQNNAEHAYNSSTILESELGELTLEDFDSSILKLNKIPKTASQTLAGQILIRKPIEPISYQGKHPIKNSTLKHFGFL